MEGPNSIEEQYAQVQEAIGDTAPNAQQLERDQLLAELRAAKQQITELRVQKERRDLVAQGMLERIQELELVEDAFKKSTSQGVVEFIADIQKENIAQKEALRQRTEQATRDKLTGLLNRHGFEEEVRPVFKAFIRQGQVQQEQRTGEIDFSIITLDIDKFKNINDTYGHPAGDEALRLLAEVLKANQRGNDTVARYGGEEFVVALVGLEPGARYKVAERLRQAVEKIEFSAVNLTTGKMERVPLSASFGTARYQSEQPDPGTPDGDRVMNVINKVLVRADNAMYQAKNTGRNKVVVAEVMEETLAKQRDQVLALFEGGEDITPDDAERALDISQDAATRFLNSLVKDGIVEKVGENERGMAYRKIQRSAESAV